MLFKLTNKNSDRMTHCGVLEFVADEGICYLPHWVRNSNKFDVSVTEIELSAVTSSGVLKHSSYVETGLVMTFHANTNKGTSLKVYLSKRKMKSTVSLEIMDEIIRILIETENTCFLLFLKCSLLS